MKTMRKPSVKVTVKSRPKMKRVSAPRTLIRAEGDQCFWVNNGPILSDIRELDAALKTNVISEAQWNHHVSKTRNDFADWVEHVFRNHELATKLRAASTRDTAKKVIAAVLAR